MTALVPFSRNADLLCVRVIEGKPMSKVTIQSSFSDIVLAAVSCLVTSKDTNHAMLECSTTAARNYIVFKYAWSYFTVD